LVLLIKRWGCIQWHDFHTKVGENTSIYLTVIAEWGETLTLDRWIILKLTLKR
jgi:hypothetical protein